MYELEKLQGLIETYGEHKAEKDKYTKLTDTENKVIKQEMARLNLGECEAGEYIAKYQLISSESFDEDSLITCFLSVPYWCGVNDEYEIVKYTPYIDMNALENAIYDGRFDPKLLAEYKQIKKTERLTIKTKK